MNMNGCLNILWHFPFFGFLFAFFYALFGAILCCTVILYPVGLGFFQIARFLFTPFSSALVTRRELNLVRPEERSTAAAAYSTVITVLYFPFGLIAAAGALFAMIGEFLSIIGIPCGIVWFKALPAIFMPVDKVCVPKAVADEIARIKAGDTVRHYKGETGEPETLSAERHFTEDPGETLPPMPEVRQYDDEKLHEIVSDAAIYRASLVEECRRELEIRSKGAALMPKIEAYDDAGLREVLANPQMYSDEVLYCCQKVDAERRRIVRERQEREAELARLQREQEKKAAAERRAKEIAEARLKRAAAWKKWRPYVFASIAVLILTGAGIGYYCYHKEQVRLEQERMRIEQVRIANQKRAEERRIAANIRAERLRIAEQERVEKDRIAAEKKRIAAKQKQEQQRAAAEAQRIAAEKAAAEQHRIAEAELAMRMDYKIGDLYEKDNKNGIVIKSVSGPQTKGLIISLQESCCTWYEASKLCKNGWRFPTLTELKLIDSNKERINTNSVTHGKAAKLGNQRYWSSESGGKSGDIWCYSMGSGVKTTWNKDSKNFIRLVHDL